MTVRLANFIAATALTPGDVFYITQGGVEKQLPASILADSISLPLTAPTGSSLVGFQQSGTGAVARTVQDKAQESVSVKDYGADPTGATDCASAFLAAVTYCKTLVAPKLIIPAGNYTSSTVLNFDLPNYSIIEFQGTITCSTSGVKIGSSTGNTFGLTVSGLKVARTANDTSSGSIGVQIRSLVNCYIDVRSCTGFQDGVYCLGTSANGGFSYNEIHLGNIQDNRNNVHLAASGAGYCNENNFYGGNYNHSSGYSAVSTNNILIDYFAASQLNDNRFFAPSLEDNSALAVAANISGNNNLIFWPRMENPGNQTGYQIVFTANSSQCQVIGGGFTLVPSNISDLGSQNSYETQQGRVYQAQATVAAGRAVQILRGTFSDSAKALLIQNTAGADKLWVNGDGTIISATNGYFETGIRFSTSSGTFQDYGMFVGTGSPETVVTAGMGSLYLNKSGGAGTTLYVKQSGSGNTGWIGK